MAKSIVILNGSPRQKGNTSMLVEAFAEGARSAGHTVTEFFLGGFELFTQIPAHSRVAIQCHISAPEIGAAGRMLFHTNRASHFGQRR